MGLLGPLTRPETLEPGSLKGWSYVQARKAVSRVVDAHREELGVEPKSVVAAGTSSSGFPAAQCCLIVLGLGAGLSPFFFAYYNPSVWVPVGLALVVACAIGVVARPTRVTGPTTLALAGLLGLGAWSLSSTAWADSVQSAVVSGNRWLVYGALLLLMLLFLRSERRSAALLTAVGVGVVAVALSVLLRLLGSDPGTLFLGGRLNSPLGYINGEGCLFVMGVWLCMAAAESRRAHMAGPAAGMATLMACLALLSQSRGTALAMLGSVIAVVALTPGSTRRVYGLLVVAGGVALAAPDLLHIYDQHAGSTIPVAAGHAAGRAALLSAAAVGVVWAVVTHGWESVPNGAKARARIAGSWLLVVPLVLVLGLAVGSAHRLERDVRSQWHSFTHLAEPQESAAAASSASHSRLLSGAGNRYDYWRIAWRVWRDNPVLGVGAGNYPRSYYEHRATAEDIDQPHSIELQVLSELGLVGVLVLAGFIGGIVWGAVRMRPAAARSPRSRALMVGGLGAFVAWLVQTSVDWMHLLPGLTAIALAGVAVLVRPRGGPLPAARPVADSRSKRARLGRPAFALGAGAVVATLIVAGASLSRQGLSDIYRSRAQSELVSHPEAALKDVNRSLDIDADSVQSYYVKAAALARFGQASAAEAALKDALAHEPDNFVTWTLLGDIARRENRTAVAERDYAKAYRLNPRDATLSALAHAGRAVP
jgi:hypothetical protein